MTLALQVFYLDGFRIQQEIEAQTQDLPKPPTLKSQSLLAYLIWHRQRPSPREKLMGMFWGNRPAGKARQSLSTALWHIRRCLPEEGAIQGDNYAIQFQFPGEIWLDAELFVQQASQADEAGLRAAVNLYKHPFLDGFYDDWVVDERYRLQAIYLDLLTRLMHQYEHAVQPQTALQTAFTLLAHDPIREDAHRVVMRAYAQLGQRNAALAQYQTCQKTIHDELGIGPMAETTKLYEAILAGTIKPVPTDVRLATPFPAGTAVPPLSRTPFDVTANIPLVGRNKELALLEAQWQAVCAGQGNLLWVAGEAGVGKTRLLEAFAAQVRAQGVPVLNGRCYEFERRLPYQPIVEALRPLLIALSAHDLRQLPDWTMQEIARLIPELLDKQPDHRQPATQERDGEQNRLFRAITHLLVTLSTRHPALLLLEDCHWAAESTLQLIHFLARQLAEHPILIICSYRQEMVHRRHALRLLQRQLKKEGSAYLIPLKRLTREDVIKLIYDMAGQEETAVPLSQQLYRETEGNPFYLVETIKSLFETGQLVLREAGWFYEEAGSEGEALPLPASVSEAIQARAERLPENTQAALRIAAVLGREFDFDLLDAAWDQDTEVTLAALSDLLRYHLIQEGSGITERDYIFTHHKIQEVVYSHIPSRHRQFIHIQAGLSLEQLAGEGIEAAAAELAYHFERGRPLKPDLTEKTIHYLHLAGEHAAGQFANAEAITYFSQALKLTSPSMPVQYHLLRAREKIYDIQGQREAQEEDLIALEQLATTVDNRQWQVEVALRRANYAEVTGDYAGAIAAIQFAADRVETDALRASVYVQWGRTLWQQGAYDAARPRLETALQLAEATAVPHLQAQSWQVLGLIAWNQGEYPQAKDHLTQALQFFRQEGLRQAEADVLGNLGAVARYMGEYAQSQTYLERALHIFQTVGDLNKQAKTSLNLGIVLKDQGHNEAAKRYYQQAYQIGRQTKSTLVEAFALNSLGTLSLDKGELATAANHFDRALTLLQELRNRRGEGVAVYNRGYAADLQGHYESAQKYYEQALTIRREIGDQQGTGFALEGIGRVFLNRGDYGAARTYSEQALQIYTEIGLPVGEASVLGQSGRLAMQVGDWQTAHAYYEQALSILHDTDHRQEKCKMLAYMAHLHACRAEYTQATAVIEQADTMAQELGDRPLQAMALTITGHIHLAQSRPAAIDVYQEALTLRRAMAQHNLTLEPLAGLAQMALVKGDVAAALDIVAEITTLLEEVSVDGSEFPGQVYLTCYDVLTAGDDNRALHILQFAYTLLQNRAATIQDEALRHSFWHNIPAHRALHQAYTTRAI